MLIISPRACPRFLPFRQRLKKAGKLVLEQIRELSGKNVDFGFESTLSGKSYIKHFKSLKQRNYKLHIFFLWVPNTDLAISRIKERVREGGHNVPIRDVKRRFHRSLHNFLKIYRPLIDSWLIFNNAGIRPALIAKSNNGDTNVIDEALFNRMLKQAGVA